MLKLRFERVRWEHLRTEIIMALLLVFLIPLGALAIYAVVYDLRRRRRRDDPRSHDISTAARLARTNTDAHGVSGLGQGTNVGGVGGGGGPGTWRSSCFTGKGAVEV
jgi:L-aminopeptidase/D-esterase-like protein